MNQQNRGWVRGAAGRGIGGLLLAAVVSSLALAAERPNILLIVSEDNGPELSCYGDPFVRTPHLDTLAAEGVRFERVFVAQAGCSPSRASFLTGLYPHQHGQVGLATWGFRMYRVDTPHVRESIANHYNCMMRLDSLVGDLLAELERSGKAADTLVVYIGDHGADMLRGKRTCYEGGLRIPLIVRWPAHAQAGQVRTELVSTIDLAPTFLAVAGAKPIEGLPGRSLAPLLAGERPAWRTELFAEFHTHAAESNFYPQRSVRTDRYKLIENLLPGEVNPGVAFTFQEFDTAPAAIAAGPAEVRDAYRLMERPPRYELYDLEADPHEFRNLADDPAHEATRAELAAALTAWREETGDPLLDPAVLHRFAAEVRGVGKKNEARAYAWGYPDYFFGREPAAAGQPAADTPRGRKKKRVGVAP